MEALNLTTWLFDGLLGAGLLWLAWQTLSCDDLFKAIVLFIAFGLLMALVWVRLDAPDVALAEAAIGAGLTGALLMAALAKLESARRDEENLDQDQTVNSGVSTLQYFPLVAMLLVAGGLGYGILSLPPYAEGLSAEVTLNLHSSGVSNPVTAVLLNYRGYDTLLEMMVLLVALLAVWSFGEATRHSENSPGIVLNTLTRLLTPVLILVAAYLLWVGAHAPGGAFQAGSVLGATGVLLLLSGWRLRRGFVGLPLRLILLAGPAAFITMAMASLFIDRQLLEYPPAQAGLLILMLETLATLSIGATLAALFLGGRPPTRKLHNRERQ